MRLNTVVLALILLVASVFQGARAEVVFVEPEIWADTSEVTSLRMSRDGKRIAMLKRPEQGALYEIFTFEVDDPDGTMAKVDVGDRLIPSSVSWAGNNHLIISAIEEAKLSKDWVRVSRITALDLETGDYVNLIEPSSSGRDIGSKFAEASAQGSLVNSLPTDDRHVIVSIVEGANNYSNYYKVDVTNGAKRLIYKGNDLYGDLLFDWDGELRGAATYEEDGPRIDYWARQKGQTEWKRIGTRDSGRRDRFEVLGFIDREDPNQVLVSVVPDGDNTTAIYSVNLLDPSERELLFQTEVYDTTGVIQSPVLADDGKVVGFTYADEFREEPYYIDSEIGALHASIQGAFPDDVVTIVRMSDDRSTTLFWVSGPQNPGAYYIIKDGRAAKLADAKPSVPKSALSEVIGVMADARDGAKIPTLVTKPAGEGPFPGIVMPHGGPWVRDYYGYDEWAQMLANRGYVVVQPNYRGSTELGQKHWIDGDREWGQIMQNDIEDSLLHLTRTGLVDPDKLAIWGWSYGGYAAFTGATRENSPFNCSAVGAGVSDIGKIRGGLSGSRFLQRYQQPTIAGFSPLQNAENVSIPMFIVHGVDDETVPISHSRRFVDRLRSMGADFEYIEIDDMAHNPWAHTKFRDYMTFYPGLFEFLETKCGF